MKPPFMLDTNVVSAFMHGRSRALDRRISAYGKDDLCVSVVSYGETRYGLALRPGAKHLAAAAELLFGLVKISPWTPEAACRYGEMRAELRRRGRTMQPLDMLIAAHALEAGATLVTSDRAFRFVPGLAVENWLDD
ncbi:type II toxin-antitoxin system VapC family toxin [Chelativorans sp. AA-79]|uniref:type II toxin-antitoxin system VapC family toxin n=1 Tax=Chelativorans sp. AA-79 TaxID=3028735 RepID=UPI0023F92800|nr:type II toxin-antitoxin system VapC family toxin [Chelativorans sp. AA-79]WEX10169.1 type II toxin-antitoxin system VapC family toxin [Chelativorans sp. AA-79]